MSQQQPPPGPPYPAYGSQPAGPPPPRRRRGLLIGLVALVLIVLAGVGGLVVGLRHGDSTGTAGEEHTATPVPQPSSPSASSSTPEAGTPAGLQRFYAQRLAWRSCAGSDKCAVLEVPLDYAHPDGETIKLAVLDVPARDQSEKVGAMVVNPGGPGGSGVQYAAGGSLQFGNDLADHYDIIGFDPRGVGSSTPLKCVDTAQLDTFLAADPAPATAAGRAAMDRSVRAFGDACLAKSGNLVRHMSTVEAAKDMDILRAALGESKLTYFGASYGTFLGATYANLFPTHVGRMVLDGALDPALSNYQLNLQQAHGFETALRSYVKSCVDAGSCFLGDTVDAGTKRIARFLQQTREHPLDTGTDRELTVGLAMLGVWMPLYLKSYWPQLTTALQAGFKGDGSKLLQLADLYTSRGANGYEDNSTEALYAVNCLDHDDYIPTSQVPKYFPEFEKASPTFGKAFAFNLSTCASWPVKSGHHTVALHAKGAPPIVVIGTTRDPATPVAWAKALAKELDSGVLITRDGDGHTAFNQGNSCVDDAVNDYFVKGTVPTNGLAC